jgi:hypothetical protein
MGRDLLEAAALGEMNDVAMPLTDAAARTLPSRLEERDRRLALDANRQPVQRCSVCDFELASPFRAAGVHPECIARQAAP